MFTVPVMTLFELGSLVAWLDSSLPSLHGSIAVTSWCGLVVRELKVRVLFDARTKSIHHTDLKKGGKDVCV